MQAESSSNTCRRRGVSLSPIMLVSAFGLVFRAATADSNCNLSFLSLISKLVNSTGHHMFRFRRASGAHCAAGGFRVLFVRPSGPPLSFLPPRCRPRGHISVKQCKSAEILRSRKCCKSTVCLQKKQRLLYSQDRVPKSSLQWP